MLSKPIFEGFLRRINLLKLRYKFLVETLFLGNCVSKEELILILFKSNDLCSILLPLIEWNFIIILICYYLFLIYILTKNNPSFRVQDIQNFPRISIFLYLFCSSGFPNQQSKIVHILRGMRYFNFSGTLSDYQSI